MDGSTRHWTLTQKTTVRFQRESMTRVYHCSHKDEDPLNMKDRFTKSVFKQ